MRGAHNYCPDYCLNQDAQDLRIYRIENVNQSERRFRNTRNSFFGLRDEIVDSRLSYAELNAHPA